MHVARFLSLDAVALSEGEIKPKGAVSNVTYKRNAAVPEDKLTASSLLAASLSNAILQGTSTSFRPLPSDPLEMHQAILESGQGKVDFDSLLAYCWEHGIPVLPLSNLPVGLSKMDGAALQVGERPVIVMAKKNDSKAWLSFILAHEVAHIALGHLQPDSVIVDISLQKETTFSAEVNQDNIEAAADAFALAMLGGPRAERSQAAWPDGLAPTKLAVLSRKESSEIGCAPGHLILRYAFRTKRWPDAINALKFLREDFDAQWAIVESLAVHIDLDSLAQDMQDLIAKVTGITQQSR